MKNNKKQTITILLAIVPVLFVVSLAIILKHNQPKEYVPIEAKSAERTFERVIVSDNNDVKIIEDSNISQWLITVFSTYPITKDTTPIYAKVNKSYDYRFIFTNNPKENIIINDNKTYISIDFPYFIVYINGECIQYDNMSYDISPDKSEYFHETIEAILNGEFTHEDMNEYLKNVFENN